MRIMSGIFWEMDFVSLMNPLYALPIVAVIIFAILVYAFGFRSVQPPSFEEIEPPERKVGKKRRSKESQKSKTPSEKSSSSSKKSSDGASNKSVKKGKTDKHPVAEETESKSAKKAKRKVPEKTVPAVNEQPAAVQEDDNDDGWKPASKKGKKKRKQEDTVNVETSTSENSLVEPGQVPEESAAAHLLSTQEINQQSTSENEESSQKDNVDTKPKPSKKSGKGNTKVVASVKDDEIAEEPEAEKVNFMPTEVKSSLKGGSNKPAAEKGQKKKKKAELPANAVEVVAEVAPQPPQEGTVQETKSLDSVMADIHNGAIDEKPAEKSNVMFDELEGLYPVPKAQRRRKSKPRREN